MSFEFSMERAGEASIRGPGNVVNFVSMEATGD